MPKAVSRKRPPTEADLTKDQREFFKSLPEDFRDGYLKTLPPVAGSGVAGRRKAQAIRGRIVLVDRVIQTLQSHREHLDRLAKNLEQGANAEAVDLRQELKPPVVQGVAIRYIRAPGSNDSEA